MDPEGFERHPTVLTTTYEMEKGTESDTSLSTTDAHASGSDSEEYDTDLEESFKEDTDFHKTQEEMYLQTCRQLDTPPVSRFLRELCTDAVDLQHYGIGDNGVLAVAAALERNITVTKLNLHDNSLTHVGAEALAEMLKDNCFISQLDVSENRLETKGVESFGEMLNENNSLWNLALENCGLHERDLHKLLQGDRIELRVLNLKGNELGDEGAIVVGSFIRSNSSLEVLDLSWNVIRLRGVAALAKGLKANRALRTLCLSRNSISNEGAAEIGEALAINKFLQILDVSNCGFNEIGAESILEGLRTNTSLETLKIGRNLFHDYGVYKLLKKIRKNSSHALKKLDMDDTTLDQACVQELDMLIQERPGFTCICGTVIKGACLTKPPPRNASKTPIVVQRFLSFVNKRGWRLIDLFRIITRNDFSALRMTVDRDRFVQGLIKLGVPLRKVQIDELFDILDVDGDGVVKFREFLAMKLQAKPCRK